MITLKDVNKYFSYDKENGKLFWKDHWHNATKSRILGKEAGTIVYNKGNKYVHVGIYGKQYGIHRLIYFIEINNYDDGLCIDHIDGNGLNNRINNLRLVTNRKNTQNRKSHRNGRLVGAHYITSRNKWESSIQVNGKRVRLGRYDTELKAHNAYKNAHYNLLGIKI